VIFGGNFKETKKPLLKTQNYTYFSICGSQCHTKQYVQSLDSESRKCQIILEVIMIVYDENHSNGPQYFSSYIQSFGCFQQNLCVCKDIKGKGRQDV
jgi:hypothetical protein